MKTNNKAATQPTAAKHTPGPWKAEAVYLDRLCIEAAGGTIADIRRPSQILKQQGFAKPSAKERAIEQANARLIAAAPDLLAALENCEGSMHNYLTIAGLPEDDQGRIEFEECMADARAAMARAKGQTA